MMFFSVFKGTLVFSESDLAVHVVRGAGNLSGEDSLKKAKLKIRTNMKKK